MTIWTRVLILIAGLMGAGGVTIAAAGAHLGGGDVAKLASTFLLIHAAAVPGILANGRGGIVFKVSASMIAAGAICFSSDLASLAFGGPRLLPGMAPFGGLLLIAGWLALSIAATIGGRAADKDRT